YLVFGMSRNAVERGKFIEIALDVVVVPAAYGEHRNVDAIHVLAHAEAFPEIVVSRVSQRLLISADKPARGRDVGGAQRHVIDIVGEFRTREPWQPEILGKP